jgi:hypothetical protein
MIINDKDDVLFGCTQKIGPSTEIISELVKNGKSPMEIDIFLNTGISVKEYETLHCYLDAAGYRYEWGHIIEVVSPLADDETHNFCSWNFCFDDLLKIFHDKGYYLEDLSRFCFYLLTSDNRFGRFKEQIPNYIMVGDGNQVSCFEFIAIETAGYDFKEIELSREWLSRIFLGYILEEFMTVVKTRSKKLLLSGA